MFLSSLISCFQSSHQGSTRDDQASLFDNSIGDIYETKEENIYNINPNSGLRKFLFIYDYNYFYSWIHHIRLKPVLSIHEEFQMALSCIEKASILQGQIVQHLGYTQKLTCVSNSNPIENLSSRDTNNTVDTTLANAFTFAWDMSCYGYRSGIIVFSNDPKLKYSLTRLHDRGTLVIVVTIKYINRSNNEQRLLDVTDMIIELDHIRGDYKAVLHMSYTS